MNIRYHKKLSFVILLCLIGVFQPTSYGQTIYVKGMVWSAEVEPLELANVIAYRLRDSSIASFSITNGLGKFELEVDPDTAYFLKISYLGYQEWATQISPTKDLTLPDIAMKLAENSLTTVNVVYEMPVVVSGDTTSFRVESFTNGKERKLKDVFEKLPGFQVEDDGAVKVNGKRVEKLTIDGKDFFTGDTKLASKNLPANVIERVNVLKNHNDKSPMRGWDNEEKLAIDLRLKADKKNIVFGSVEAGGGLDNRYIGHTNAFYFAPKMSMNFIGDLNNIGNQVLSFQDYFRFNGGFDGVGEQQGVSMQLSANELGLSFRKDNKAKELEAKIGALNFVYNPNDRIQFSGFAIVSGGRTLQENRTSQIYTREEDNEERIEQSNNQYASSQLFQLSTKYTPNPDFYLKHGVFLKNTNISTQDLLASTNSFFDNSFDSNRKLSVPSGSQNLEVFYTHNEKMISSLLFSQTYNERYSNLELYTQEEIYPNTLTSFTSNNGTWIQDVAIQTHKLDLSLSQYYILNKTNHLHLEAGGIYQYQELTSELFLENQNTNEIDNPENNLQYEFRDVYVGLNYKSKFSKFTLDLGLSAHDFNLKIAQDSTFNKTKTQLLIPKVKIEYHIRKSNSLTLNYALKTEFKDIQSFTTSAILRNYNNLFFGNNRLSNSLYHAINLDYYSLNLFTFTNIYGLITYQRKYDHISTLTTFDQLGRLTTPINIANPNDFVSVYGSYDRRFKYFKVEFNTSIGYSRFNSLLEQGQELWNTSVNQSYRGSVESNVENLPILELGWNYRINRYRSDIVNDQVYITSRPFANIEWSFLNGFILVADYEYNWYRNKANNVNNIYDILNMELFYQGENSPFEFKLAILNLLNTQSIRNDSFTDILIRTNEYFIQQRFYVGSLKYEF